MTADVVMVIDRSAEAWSSVEVRTHSCCGMGEDVRRPESLFSECCATHCILKSSMYVKVTIVRMQIVLPRFSMTQAVHS